MLPLIAAAIYLQGRAVDPDMFTLNPAALAARSSPTTVLPAAMRLPADPEIPRSDGGVRTSSFVLPRRLSGLGWDADGPPEQFTPQTLYQKIDGRADAYLKDGFAGLETISYAHAQQFIDVFVYDMSTDAHAQARFTAERPAAAAPVALGRAAYCVTSSCFLVVGRYYVQVVGSDPGADAERAARGVLHEVAILIGEQRR